MFSFFISTKSQLLKNMENESHLEMGPDPT